MKRFLTWMLHLVYRPADFIIGSPDNPYMLRWYILPRNHWFNIYLHKIVRSDDDRALHDHPWASVSILLRGRYVEVTQGNSCQYWNRYQAGNFIYRSSNYSHRLEVFEGEHCWTLFITGPKVRTWGFYCPRGWVPWHEFVDHTDHGNVGRGCGDQ